jgi:hypothetical protein
MIRSDIVRSYDISIYTYLRNILTDLHSGCINLHSHKQCIRFLFSPLFHENLMLLVALMTAILTVVKKNLNVVGFVFPLWLKMLSISSCIYKPFLFLWKCLVCSFAYLLLELFILLILSYSCVIGINPLSKKYLAKIFSLPVCSLYLGS